MREILLQDIVVSQNIFVYIEAEVLKKVMELHLLFLMELSIEAVDLQHEDLVLYELAVDGPDLVVDFFPWVYQEVFELQKVVLLHFGLQLVVYILVLVLVIEQLPLE